LFTRRNELYLLILLYFILSNSNSQNLRNRDRKRGRRNRPNNDEKQSVSAVTVNYPLNAFTDDWRTPGVFSNSLYNYLESTKDWREYSNAQDQEDIWLYENWFYGYERGVIMESGALDGILFSTSLFFESVANWTAIHVEADPENYGNLKYNRDRSVNVNGALCSESMLLHYSSLGVIPVRGFVEFMTKSFLKKWHGPIYNNKTSIDSLPTVQCLPVKVLLRELNIKHIDIWILDIEGAEESALRGTDFNQVRFNAIAMECDEHDIEKNKRKTDIIERNGFKCQLIERNCMCKNDLFVASAAPVKSLLRKWDGNKWSKTYNATAII